jgi:hypothetical protein
MTFSPFRKTRLICRSKALPVGSRCATRLLHGFKEIGVRPDIASNLASDPAITLVSGLRALGPGPTAAQLRNYIIHFHNWAGINGIHEFCDGSQRGIGPGNTQRWDAKLNDFIAVSKPGGYPL